MSQDPKDALNLRRRFLTQAGLAGMGVVLASCAQGVAQAPTPTPSPAPTPSPTPSPTPTPNPGFTDADIFNFALNLEYLEAAFYLAAVGRLGELTAAGGDASKVILPTGFNPNGGTATSPANPIGLSADVLAYTNEIASDELAHVRVIRAVLGSAAVAQPRLDLGPAFLAAGSAASSGAITGFNPYANELFFLHGAFIFEDVGVTAYKGAARLLTDRSAGGNLENAAGILAVEAYHSGSIRTQLYARRNEAAAAGLNVTQVVQAISNLRDAVDGPSDLDQGIVGGAGNPTSVPSGSANIIPTDANGIAFSRTPRQVANIVFLDTTGTATKGGFFPDGITGTAGIGVLLGL